MAKVFNWQLNRKMEYPYNQATPQRQFAAVFNINRCIGCQTCTMACKSAWTFSRGQEYMWWNNVETKPYGGYPRFLDARLLEMLGPQRWDGSTYEGKTIFEAVPAGEPALGYLPPQRALHLRGCARRRARARLPAPAAGVGGAQLRRRHLRPARPQGDEAPRAHHLVLLSTAHLQ